MKIVRVNADTAKFFAGVAPEEVLSLLSLPNASALGAVEDKEALGILVFTYQGKSSITIEWLYVDEEYRGIGAGSQLMEKVFEAAKAVKAENIYARLVEDEDFEAMQLYMLNWGFNWRETLPGEWNITAKELYTTPFGQKAISTNIDKDIVQPLSKISQKMLAEAVQKAKDERRTILYDVIKNRKSLDAELSRVAVSKDKVVGMLLIHRSNHLLIPVLLWAENDSKEIIANLIGASMQAGVKTLKGKDTIRFTAGSERTNSLISRIVGAEESKPIYIMQADADTLIRQEAFDIDTAMDGAYAIKDVFSPEDIPEGGFKAEEVEVR